MTTPSSTPDVRVAAAGEREVLAAFLDMYRDIVTGKIAGLDAAQLRAEHVPSDTTLGGLVNHLASVEDEWFSGVMREQPFISAANDGWALADDDTAETIVERYQQACERSRNVADSLPLDHTVPHAYLGQVTLRWVYVHMIEETARHAGHADILRERTDGTVGFD